MTRGMTIGSTSMPHPVLRPPPAHHDVDAAALARDLAAAVDGEVRFDPGVRGAYSTDASNYRQVPIGVVIPRTVEAAAAETTPRKTRRQSSAA